MGGTKKSMKYIHQEHKSRVSQGQRRGRSRGAGLGNKKEGKNREVGIVGEEEGRGAEGHGYWRREGEKHRSRASGGARGAEEQG